jgi:hypothetical protein
MRSRLPWIGVVALALSGCAHTYTGRAVWDDGTPIAHARVLGVDYPTLFNVPPWELFAPQIIIRGETTTDAEGRFALRTRNKIQEIAVEPDGARGFVSDPDEASECEVVVPKRRRSDEAGQGQ